jgi:hypothetical protein
MKFLAISTNLADPTPHIAAEMQQMDHLVHSGLVERLLLKADRSGAVLLMEAPDAATAQAAVDNLPLASHGITRFALTPVIEAAAPV